MTDQPMWAPGAQRIAGANMTRFIQAVREQHPGAGVSDYRSLYEFSISAPERFWSLVWDFCGVEAGGSRTPAIQDPDRMPGARFFPAARLNFAENLLRCNDDGVALLFRNEAGHQRQYSYAELRREVAALAAGLKRAGVVKGDRVAAFMPNLPETVITMLATTSLGAVFSSCSPDFGIGGVVDRFEQIEPRVLVAADAYPYGGKTFDCLPKVREIMGKLPSVATLVVVPYMNGEPDLAGLDRAVLWGDFADRSATVPVFEQVEFNHPNYIMYSSGTTGKPKCIVHGAGGTLLQHLKELVLHTDLRREDRIFYFTTCGWMMWNWLVSSLAVGATVVLYDGSPGYPSPDAMWSMADELGITIYGTSAAWLAAIEKAGLRPRETHALAQLRTILSTGSPLKPESFDYVYRDVKPDVLLASISGGTDLISCFALGNPILPVWRGEIQCRGLGMAVEALDDAGNPVRGSAGELSCLKPFPSMPVYFWNDPDGERYRNAYFAKLPGVWSHGDFVQITEHDGVIIYGRSDATLNPGGVRIGTAEIYRQVEKIPEVLECVAVGHREGSDESILLFVHLRDGITLDDAISKRIRDQIRAGASPRHVPRLILQVHDIPRTISGKISEIAVRRVINGAQALNTDALANPASLQEYTGLRGRIPH